MIIQAKPRKMNLEISNYGLRKFLQGCMDGMGMEVQCMCGTEIYRLGLHMCPHIWPGIIERELGLSDV